MWKWPEGKNVKHKYVLHFPHDIFNPRSKGKLYHIHILWPCYDFATLPMYPKKLNALLEQRRLAFIDWRRTIAFRTGTSFIIMMSTRGYSGQLKFDHKNSELIINVSISTWLHTHSIHFIPTVFTLSYIKFAAFRGKVWSHASNRVGNMCFIHSNTLLKPKRH